MRMFRLPSFVIVLFLVLASSPFSAAAGPASAGTDRLVALGLVIRANPTPESNASGPPEGVSTDHLIDGVVVGEELPPTIDTLALSRVTLDPGSQASATKGTHLFFVETGTLTLGLDTEGCSRIAGMPGPGDEASADDSRIDLGPGSQLTMACLDGMSPPLTNGGNEAMVALVISIVQTGTAGIESTLTGWSATEVLATTDAATDLPALSPASTTWTEPTAVSLVRVRLDKGAGLGPGGERIDEAMIELGSVVPEAGARLLAVESGAMNYLFADAARFQRAGDAPEWIPENARASQIPGDSILILSPGQTLMRNVGRGPSSDLLVVTVGTAGSDLA